MEYPKIMDGITIQMLVTAVIIVVTNVITLKWLKSDLAKTDKNVERQGKEIHSFYTKSNDMLTKGEFKEHTSQINDSMSSVATTVAEISVSIARMDERMKARRENNE